jgi:hypothetical protein
MMPFQLSEFRYATGGRARSSRTPLPAGLRVRLERCLGADLSAVLVRTGPVADGLTRALGADAFTAGTDIYFRRGSYQPATRPGQWLIAHEAAHVVQQARGAASADSAECERAADLAADLALAGRRWAGPPTRTDGPAAPVIQCHVSYEHRLLGDSPTSDLLLIASKQSMNQQQRKRVLQLQIALLQLWMDNPQSVTADQVYALCPWIETVTLQDGVLATYGELNALPDYLSDPSAIEQLPGSILLPILQVIRQEGYNQLTQLLTNNNPGVTFDQAACAPWSLSLVNAIVETQAIDTLTQGLGPRGQDHYQGLLGRNACHFAPFSWYRWLASYLKARDLANTAYGEDSLLLADQARIHCGYANHFLEDSFAAGHLVNKTLVMQWFIEWAAEQDLLPVADWDQVQHLTTTAQPTLAGAWLYDPAYGGPSDDPQTVQEAATLVDRLLASSVRADGPRGQYASYQNYLTFLTSAAANLASANLHDYYNTNSLWVSSVARSVPFEVWGDNTLLDSVNAGVGVQATSEAAQLATQSVLDLLYTGSTSITTQQVRDTIPTSAGPNQNSLAPLQQWTTTQKSFCVERFAGFKQTLTTLLAGFGSPRLGLVSQDQEFASVWSCSLPGSGLNAVENLIVNDRLFTASNGFVYEVEPETGKVLSTLQLPAAPAVTHLAANSDYLYAGTSGTVYGISLINATTVSWTQSLGGVGPVSLLATGKQLYAGCNSGVVQLDIADGTFLNQLRVSSIGGETRIATDGTYLFAGVTGSVAAVSLSNWKQVAWTAALDTSGVTTVLAAGGQLYAGAAGYAFVLQPSTGKVQPPLALSSIVRAEVRLATDGTYLYAGTNLYAYGILLSDFTRYVWSTKVGGVGLSGPASVAADSGKLYAGGNGYLHELDPGTGTPVHSQLLTYTIWTTGDYDVSILPAGPVVYAGVHGWTYQVLDTHVPPPAGTLLHATHSPGGWSGFARDFDGAPQVQSTFGLTGATGHTEVFAIGQDGTLYHDALDRNGWHQWTPNFNGAPKVASVYGLTGVTGNTELFAIGLDNTLLHCTLNEQSGWSSWASPFNQAPPVSSVFGLTGHTGNTELFAVGTDGTLLHCTLNKQAGWSGWTPGFDSAPTVRSVLGVAGATGNTEMFVIGTDNQLYHDTLDKNGWHGWAPGFNGAPAVQAMFAVGGYTGNTEVFLIGLDGTLYHCALSSDGWSGWTPDFDGAPLVQDITGPSPRASSIAATEVFAIGLDGKLYLNYLDTNGWHGWAAGFAGGAPDQDWTVFAVGGFTGNTELFAVAGS